MGFYKSHNKAHYSAALVILLGIPSETLTIRKLDVVSSQVNEDKIIEHFSNLIWFVFSVWKARWTQWGLGLLFFYFCLNSKLIHKRPLIAPLASLTLSMFIVLPLIWWIGPKVLMNLSHRELSAFPLFSIAL